MHIDLPELLAAGEGLQIEYKRSRDRDDLSTRDLARAAACMANAEGGHLLIGVEDDGSVSGAWPRHGTDTDPARLRADIARETEPPLLVDIVVETIGAVDVVVIEIPASPVPTSVAGTFKTRGLKLDGTPECRAMSIVELQSIVLVSSGMDYLDRVVPGAEWTDLSAIEFERFRSMAAAARSDDSLVSLSDRDVARALRAVTVDGVTLGGLVMFGTRDALARFVPSAAAKFLVLDGTEVVVNDDRVLPLFAMAEWLQGMVEARNDEDEMQSGLLRIALPRFARRASREAVANALVHRDYLDPGALVVKLTADEFVVTSPGGLPRGVSLATMLRASRPRSPMLASAMKRAGLVELAGRGVEVMFEDSLRLGRAAPDYSATSDSSVTVIFDATPADRSLVQYIAEEEMHRGRAFTLPELQIVHGIKARGPSTAAELSDHTTISAERARAVATVLVGDGVLEMRGAGRSRQYVLGPRFSRQSQQGVANARLAGVEAIRHPEMVLELARRQGSVSRSDVAALCGLTPPQASALLRRMTQEGSMVQTGSKRGTRYELVASSEE